MVAFSYASSAMKEHEKITPQDIEQAKSKLKTVLGISPRIYVSCLFLLSVLIVLFLILINPALRNPGAHLVFKGSPEAAAIYIDGEFVGNTLDGLHLDPGSHQIQIQKTGFATRSLDIDVPNRIFATLLFPPSVQISYSLVPDSAAAILIPALREYANWSLTGKPSAIYQIPPRLSEASRDLFSLPALERMSFSKSLLAVSISVAESSSSIRDALYSSFALGAPGGSPLGIISIARTALELVGSTKGGAVAIEEIAPELANARLKDAEASLAQESISMTISAPRQSGVLTVGPHSFIMFEEGTVRTLRETPGGTKVPFDASTPAFGLAAYEVTQAEYNRFLSQNPKWKLENKSALIEEELVDSAYLTNFDPTQAHNQPITGISWYAATAYCEWLSTFAPQDLKIVLPSEEMWEAAAAPEYRNHAAHAVFVEKSASGAFEIGSQGRDASGFADLFGNVWEWTSDGYRAYPWIHDRSIEFEELIRALDSKTVKGGSWANNADQISLASRGPVPASHSSEFLGFRPALVRQ